MTDAPTFRSLVTFAWRVLADAVSIALWTFLVILLALATGWSWLQFTVLLLLGVGCYVLVTSPWT